MDTQAQDPRTLVALFVCPECKQVCERLIPHHNQAMASEHYCPRCHKSYPVPEAQQAAAELERQARRNAKG